MEKVDENRLESDLQYRFQYLATFMGFNEKDVNSITGAAKHLAPRVPALVDAVYQKLFAYDATARHFVPKQSGYDGIAPVRLEDLTQDHPMIQFRKEKLARYLAKLVTGPYDEKMVAYLDVVGKIHTEKAGSPDLFIPLVQMNALMGFVADALIATLSGLDLPGDEKTQAIRSFSKLLWLQNDLINRHYQR